MSTTTISLNVLVESLQRFRLLDADQLAELTGTLQGQFPEPQALAGELVRRGWLTSFQASQLLQGRGQHLVFGPYLIQQRLGTGGNGQVFKAWHDALHRLVALKVLRKDLVTDKDAVGRFFREVEVLSHLSHPAIVHAYEAGVVGVTHFLAMEYIEGTDLDRVVRKDGPLPVTQACDYIRQAAQGLQYAHEQGLVHRDIKPSNLLVSGATGSGNSSKKTIQSALGTSTQVKILDLGLARLQQPAATSKTKNLTVLAGNSLMLGTPDYLAPEQAIDFHSADIRSDIYSLGCTFYFLLTGQPPFPGGGLNQKLIRHQQEKPPSLEAARKDLPHGLSAIVEKMLAKHPDDRYQTPGEVVQAMAELEIPGSTVNLIAERPTVAEPSPSKSSVSSLVVAAKSKWADWRRKRGYVLAAGGAIFLVVIGLAAIFWMSGTKSVPTNPTITEAKPTGSLEFHGDQVVVLPAGLFRNANVLTLEAWFKTTDYGILFGYQNQPYPSKPGSHVPVLYVATGGWLRAQFWNGGKTTIASSRAVNDGRWHHTCLVADGSAKIQYLYLDGELCGKLPGELKHLDMNHNQLGMGYWNGWPGSKGDWGGYLGKIAEVRIWYAARTAEQIRQGMRKVPAEGERDLAAYYPMNELEGDSLMDRSGRGLNLRLGLPNDQKKPSRTTDHPTK